MLALIGAGLDNRQIAHDLSIGIGTVKSDVRILLAKTMTTSRLQLGLLGAEQDRAMHRSGPDELHGRAQTSGLGVELTPRESEVLALIGAGLGNREIAHDLSIQIGTVKSHVHNLFAKTNSTSRLRLALLAAEHHRATRRSDPNTDA